MAISPKYIIGVLLIIVASTYVWVQMDDIVKMKIEATRTSFYVNENNTWILGGIEYNKLYNGSKLVVRNASSYKFWNSSDDIYFYEYRFSTYYGGASILDTYVYSKEDIDKELFPVTHYIDILNGKGLIYQYEVGSLTYYGITRTATSPEEFGHNMKVEWQDGNYYAKITKSLTNNKLVVKYRITSYNQRVSARLFDPAPTFTITNYVTESKLIFWNETVQVQRYLDRCYATQVNVTCVQNCTGSKYSCGKYLNISDTIVTKNETRQVQLRYPYLTVGVATKSLRLNYTKFNFNCSTGTDWIICDSMVDGNGNGKLDYDNLGNRIGETYMLLNTTHIIYDNSQKNRACSTRKLPTTNYNINYCVDKSISRRFKVVDFD